MTTTPSTPNPQAPDEQPAAVQAAVQAADQAADHTGRTRGGWSGPVLIASAIAVVVVGWLVVSAGTDSSEEEGGPYGYGGTPIDPDDEADDASGSGSGHMVVRGEIAVAGTPKDPDGFSRCIPSRRYSVIADGVAVRLFDDNDNLIGKGVLQGRIYNSFDKRCDFDVEIKGVPASIEGYWVQVSSQPPRYVEHHPEGITDVPYADWRTHFTLAFN